MQYLVEGSVFGIQQRSTLLLDISCYDDAGGLIESSRRPIWRASH